MQAGSQQCRADAPAAPSGVDADWADEAARGGVEAGEAEQRAVTLGDSEGGGAVR